MKLILFLILIAAQFQAQAYIPRAQTIIKKMTSNNGARDYKVVREVTIEAENRQIRAKEVWTIANGDKMKVKVSSLDSNNPWSFSILYGKTDRKTMSSGKSVKTFKKSREFFEPLFHDRSSRSMTDRLIAARLVPDWIKNTPPPNYSEGKTMMTPEPFVNLEPMEGSINYAIGSNKSSTGKNHSLIWVEQDSFLLKKGRFGSMAEFTNSQFQTYPGGLKLPSEQIISWDEKVAKVKTLSAENTQTASSQWTLDKNDSGQIPNEPLIKEFYSRFR